MLLRVLLLPLRVAATLIRLLIKIILTPVKLVIAGFLLQIGKLLILLAILAGLAYFIYQWLT